MSEPIGDTLSALSPLANSAVASAEPTATSSPPAARGDEAALRESEERFRATFEQAAVGMAHVGPEGRWLRVNQRLCKILGYACEELMALTFQDVTHPDDLEANLAHVRRLMAGEVERYSMEKRYVRKDRSILWAQLTASLVRGADGGPKYFISVIEDIDDLKRAHEANDQLAAMVQYSREGIFRVDLDGVIRTWNQAASRLFGYAAEEILGRPISALAPPDLWPEQSRLMARVRAGEATAEVDTMRLRKDGSKVDVSITISPLFNRDGAVTGAAATVRDVTERRHAEEALRRSEVRYRSLAEATAAILWTTDGRGAVVSDNPSWTQFTGQTREQYQGWGWLEAVHPDDRRSTLDAWNRALAIRSPYEVEYRILRRDGQYRQVVARAAPVPEPDGSLREWVGACTDVTDRRRTEALLVRDSMLLANVRDSVIVTDLRGVVTFWNEGATRLFGFEASEVLGRPYADRLPEPTRSEVADWIERVAAGEEFKGEFLDWRKDGSRVWIDAHTRRITDADGRVFGIMGVSHDISERKRAEAEIGQAKESAEAASRAKDQFIAILSHELRTPLTPVLTTAQMMEADPTLSAEVREQVTMIRRNVELEARLIDDMLDLTRVSRGKLELHFSPTDLHEKVKQVMAICDSDVRSKQLRVKTHLRAERRHVRADPARIQQVLWNVVKNATKFTPVGGAITIDSENLPDGRVALVVRDTGVGIAPEALSHIFDAFEQGGHEVTRLFGGLGLGLSISKALIDMHGGTLTAASEGAGRGATFTLALPTCTESEAAGPRAADDGNGSPTLHGRRILLVEDHADTSKALTALLRKRGYEVRTAGSVAAALRTIQAEPFDLVISDIGLPDGSGLDLMSQLRAKSPVRGIALSGYGMEDDVRRSKEAGFAAHLTKPVDLRKLEEVIRQMLVGE